MIPRGVATTLTLNAQWNYDNKTDFILDTVAYQLQYLNHAINFFLYILANNSFRYSNLRLQPNDYFKNGHNTTLTPNQIFVNTNIQNADPICISDVLLF